MTQDEANIYYQVMGLVVATMSVTLAMAVVSARFWKEASYLKKKYRQAGVKAERKRIIKVILSWKKFYKLMYQNGYIEWFVDDVIIDIRNGTKPASNKGRSVK